MESRGDFPTYHLIPNRRYTQNNIYTTALRHSLGLCLDLISVSTDLRIVLTRMVSGTLSRPCSIGRWVSALRQVRVRFRSVRRQFHSAPCARNRTAGTRTCCSRTLTGNDRGAPRYRTTCSHKPRCRHRLRTHESRNHPPTSCTCTATAWQ